MQRLVKTADEIGKIEKASRIVAETLTNLEKFMVAGTTTEEIDKYAEDFIRSKGATPSFKGYTVGNLIYPSSLCISINEEVIHGIPSKHKQLKNGDIVSLDCGACLNGYHGDSAVTYIVGEISDDIKQLLKVTEESLWKGIEQAVARNKVYDIARAVQTHSEKYGYGVNRDFCGHGIGSDLHEYPSIPNYVPALLHRQSFPNTKLLKGMAIAIEPMIHQGTKECTILENGWTVVTNDGLPAAHFEHTVIVGEKEALVLTLRN
jgi:methionyl aminopeptidase